MIKFICEISAKRYCVTIIFIFSAINSYTQSIETWNHNGYNAFSTISLEGGYDSDGITSLLLNSFITGGFIDRETRLQSIPGDFSMRNFGARIDGNIDICFPSKLVKKDSLNLFLTYKYENEIAIDFQSDQYKLMFFGNEQFLEDTISLSNLRWNQWNLQSIGIGVYDLKSNNYITTNLYFGQHSRMRIDDGFLYTGTDGRFLHSDISGSYFNSDFNNKNRKSTTGIGLGLNGQYNVLKSNIKSDLIINVQNIGFIIWPKSNKKVSLEENYDFNGIEIRDVFSSELSIDSSATWLGIIDSNVVPTERVELLPTTISGQFRYKVNEKNSIDIVVSSRQINLWRPLFNIGWSHSLNEKLVFGMGIKYGGYGGINYKLRCVYDTQKRWTAGIYINYLQGFISSKGYGGHAGLSVRRRMNFNLEK